MINRVNVATMREKLKMIRKEKKKMETRAKRERKEIDACASQFMKL